MSYVFWTMVAIAQNISVNAPSQVGVGEQFKLMYTINTQDVKGFRAGNIPEGLDVLMGPSTSSQSSIQIINGHTSSSSSITYTYIVSAEKAGTYTIPAAHAVVNGKAIASAAHKIKVSGQAQGNNAGGNVRNNPGAQVRQAGSTISGNDLFIRVSANKQRVHEQEPVLLTYKVYTQLELTQLEGKMPDLKGFHTQEIQLPQQKSFHVENVNGRPYRCVTWSQYVMYPQMTGKLQIPSITFKGIVVQENRNVDPFEAFFNGGSGYIEVKKDIVAPAVDIQVDPLPQRPADFSGGVGQFSISSSLDKQTVAANDPVTMRVVVSGNGNLKLIKQPEVNFPKDFDKYSPKSTDKTKLTANGLEGNMVYDFLFVPRNQGEYTIPAVTFTYYDTSANAYRTIKTNPLKLEVTPSTGGKSSVTDFSETDHDIHGLKTDDSQTCADDIFFGSMSYNFSIAIILLAFFVLIWVFRRQAIANADIVGTRGRKANKVATKRLKKAAKLMAQHKEAEFYDEVLRALWGYVGDKLNIPVSELSRENITERLLSHNVDNGIITVFVDAIDECEYARYAPGEKRGKMNNVYEKAMNGITNIDDFLKGKSSSKKAATTMLVLLLAMFSGTSFAAPADNNVPNRQSANQAYDKGNYELAVKTYEMLSKTNPSAENFYNLGNAYFRTDNIPQAIIAYNKAALISPSDADIQHNLKIARSKTIDKMQPRQTTFIVAGWHSLTNLFNTNTWASISIVSLVLVVLLTLTYLFAEPVLLRQLGFYGAILLFVIFILANACAYSQYSRLTANDGAVVISDVCHVMKLPEAKANVEMTIHEGTHMQITDESIKGWYEVVLDDGTEGWVEQRCIERIILTASGN